MANEVRLIDANALRRKWQNVLDIKSEDKGSIAYQTFELFIDRLKEEPTIDPESLRPKGRWEECDWAEPDDHYSEVIRAPKAGLMCTECRCCFKKRIALERQLLPQLRRKDGGVRNAHKTGLQQPPAAD